MPLLLTLNYHSGIEIIVKKAMRMTGYGSGEAIRIRG